MHLILPTPQQWWLLSAGAAAAVLFLMMALELRSTARLRGTITRDLARVFEQLDLVRFEALRPQSAAPGFTPALPLADAMMGEAEAEIVNGQRYLQAERLARDGAEAHVLVDRCGLSLAEARLVIAMHTLESQ